MNTDDRNQQQPLAPDLVGQPAADRQRDRRGDDVARQHPVDRVLRRAEARLHVRQRDVGDGRVEHLQQHRHHHPDGDDQPLAGRQRMGCEWAGVSRPSASLLLAACRNRRWRSTDRPAIIGFDGLPSNAIRTGTRWVTLTQLPLAFCAGSSENSLPVPAPMLWTWRGELLAGISVDLDRRALARDHPADVLLLEIGFDPSGLAVDQADACRRRSPPSGRPGACRHFRSRRPSARGRRSATGRAAPCRPRPAPGRSAAARPARPRRWRWRRGRAHRRAAFRPSAPR